MDLPSGDYVPVEIEQMEDQDPADNKDEAWAHYFVLVEEQVKERKEKMSKYQAKADPEPTGLFPRVGINFTNDVPKGFLWYVGTVN